jgi:hypothetical protein
MCWNGHTQVFRFEGLSFNLREADQDLPATVDSTLSSEYFQCREACPSQFSQGSQLLLFHLQKHLDHSLFCSLLLLQGHNLPVVTKSSQSPSYQDR